MLADLVLIIVFIGIAVYGAWDTAHVRHIKGHLHKRRRTDH